MVVVKQACKRWLGLLGATMVVLPAAHVAAFSSSSECIEEWFADGSCDNTNNRAECGYDSGDCCSCTCMDTRGNTCNYFACIDPNATCVDDDDITAKMVENCDYVYGVGNGYCEQGNNNAGCGYDGGDCCSCTCTGPENSSDDDYRCNKFACIDPGATCVDDDDITVEMVENCEYLNDRGDGYCNAGNNNAACGYDGGDCCSCTCAVPETEWDDDYGCSEFACVDPEAACVEDDDMTVDMIENCGYLGSIGNGYCNENNNNELCNYDGGDCCECTCTVPETEWDDDYGCSKFACVDPKAKCVNDDDITVDMVGSCGYTGSIGNGNCDEENNNELCNYDGGDCCECTCVPREANDDWDYDNYVGCSGGFACIDPKAPCVNDDDITLDIVVNCDSVQVGNGHCDEQNNNAECGYDGGDCCACTCEDTPNTKCGEDGGFACIDPEVACVDDDSITVDMLDNCYATDIGNGRCDDFNNKAECAYDGGDCCSCTCMPSIDDRYSCSDFTCIDPDAACVNDDDLTIDMFDNCGYVPSIGDGYCDRDNNKEECGYDGGDCCECTCVRDDNTDDDYSWPDSQCYDLACIDPDAACVNDDGVTIDIFDNCRSVFAIGDGYCHLDNNNAECGYDGGDCCECTCVRRDNADDDSGGRYAQFGPCKEFACIDPDAACVNDDDIIVDMFENCGDVLGIGNGYCERGNNKEECGWDGGDCCSCTCQYAWDDDWGCNADSVFDCKDTTAPCYGEEPTTDDDGSMSYEFINDFDDFVSDFSNVFVPWEQEGPLPTLEGAVEVGTKTEVGVSATAYDVRPGAHAGQAGCGEDGGDGCTPANSRDGISSEVESRWSCSVSLVENEGPCVIEYTFSEPQDIMDIQVAFWKGEERIRTLDVHLDGVRAHTHESYAGSTFNTLGVSGSGVTTVALEPVGLQTHEWISLLEVLIFVPE